MARVVVVGAGFAGLSSAARLAKLRHDVVLLESDSSLGGRLRGVELDGRHFELSPPLVTLPGVFRDLFRKSGRTLEASLGLDKVEGRTHVFPDKSRLDLPLGNRGDQVATLADWPQDGEDWSTWVDGHADTWETLRMVALGQVLRGRSDFTRAQWKMLRPRRSVTRELRTVEIDASLDRLVLDPLLLEGHDPRLVPSFATTRHYIERNFGLWAFDGGSRGLNAALGKRLQERKVDVRTQTHASDITMAGGSVTGVVTGEGKVEADVVVWCAPTVPGSVKVSREMPAMPAAHTFVSLGPDAPTLPPEVFAHADPPLRLYEGEPGSWTIQHRSGEDPVIALARCGIDLRAHVETRHDMSPVDLVRLGHWGWAWQRWSTAFAIPGIDPRGGVYFAGAHAHPGTSLELIGMATAAIANDIGKA